MNTTNPHNQAKNESNTLATIGRLKEEIETRERKKKPVTTLLYALDCLIEQATRDNEWLCRFEIGPVTIR